jgi:hypothetical protein
MCKYVFLILLILTNKTHSEAQISNNVSGKDISNQFGSIAYTIGEVFYVQKGSQYFLTEGIQNGITINPVKSNSSIKVSVYPNPTSDFINFKVQNLFFNNLSFILYNDIGHELLKGTILNSNTTVSLSQFPSSVYLIKIYRNQTEMAVYKIIKIN